MEECCSGGTPTIQKGVQKSKRRKVWELESHWHCPIIGTCLTVSDLKTLARKLGIRFADEAHDYNRHVHFAGAIRKHDPAAKLINKLLDRRYRAAVNQFHRADSPEALLTLWDKARTEGKIPGPLWAAITHPCADKKVGNHVFADIHMLSHMVGASNQADIRRLSDLEKQKTELEAVILKERKRFNSLLEERRMANAELKMRLADADMALTKMKTRLRNLEIDKSPDDLQRTVKEQNSRIMDAEQQMDRLKGDLNIRNREAQFLRTFNDDLQGQCGELRMQCSALEEQLGMFLAPTHCENSDCPVAGGEEEINLCRKCIAFVGGRSRQTPHFRALVEKSEGEFLHHDGGIDESQGKLEAVLAKADVIFFPVDCISHGASTNIKRHCKRFNKPFVPLATSSLSTFVTGLREATKPGSISHQSPKK